MVIVRTVFGLAACSILQADAAHLVIDSFNENGFVLSRFSEGNSSLNSGPIGEVRTALLNARNIPLETDVRTELNSVGGFLDHSVDGPPFGVLPVSLTLQYRQGGPFSLLGNDAFEFDFLSITGEGSLIVRLGFNNSGAIPPNFRIPLTEPGTVTVDSSKFLFGLDETEDWFHLLTFAFEANTEQFSFTLEEIRAVPEPSSSLLMALAVGLTCLRRRRGSSGRGS